MIINNVNIVLEADDLRQLLNRAVESQNQLKEIGLSFENGVVVLSGKVALGLTVPFKTKWKVEPVEDGYTLRVNLADVSVGMIGVGAQMITAQIMTLLQSRLSDMEGVRVANEDILVDAKVLLAARGIALRSPVRSIEMDHSGLSLKV